MLESHPEGVLVQVWVVAGASRDQVVGSHGEALKVRVRAAAADGAANRSESGLVASALGGRSGSVVAGSSTRRKQLVVSDVSHEEAEAALRALGIDGE